MRYHKFGSVEWIDNWIQEKEHQDQLCAQVSAQVCAHCDAQARDMCICDKRPTCDYCNKNKADSTLRNKPICMECENGISSG
jgi:hypothetical protein